MKRIALMALIAALTAAPALAQPAPPGPPGGPAPEVQQRMQAARDAARTQAMTALSSDHQTKVNAILARVKAGQLTDARDAAKAIDAVLTPKEGQSVLAARDRMLTDVRGYGGGAGSSSAGPGPGAGGPAPSGDPGPGNAPPPGGGPPPDGGPPPGGGPSADGNGGPPGMGGGGGAPRQWGRHHGGGHAMRNDPGFAVLMLSLDPDQMRALFADAGPPR